MVGQRPIELQELSQYFNMPEKAVAKSLGICLTSLKKICRQHGVTRWPYRKIKSLDKKLRKLEVAMSTAKDDPSMVFAKWGEGSEEASPAASSPPCSDDASFASTPRQMHDFSPTPDARRSPVDQPLSAEARLLEQGPEAAPLAPIPVRLSPEGPRGSPDEPVKIELSLTPSMLQSVAAGGGAISFVVEGMDSLDSDSHALSASLAPPLPALAVPDVKQEPADDAAAAHEPSDEELIALLAMCAGTHEASARAHRGAAPQLELSDEEIMQALAGCCEAPSAGLAFGHAGPMSPAADDGGESDVFSFSGDDDDAFSPFDFVCGGPSAC